MIRYSWNKKVHFFIDDRSSFQWSHFCNTYDHGVWFLASRIKFFKLGIHFYSKWSHGNHGWKINK